MAVALPECQMSKEELRRRFDPRSRSIQRAVPETSVEVYGVGGRAAPPSRAGSW